jgi:hypothetical protein
MTEIELMCKADNDDELSKLTDTGPPASRSSTPTKTKRARLTFPFGPW